VQGRSGARHAFVLLLTELKARPGCDWRVDADGERHQLRGLDSQGGHEPDRIVDARRTSVHCPVERSEQIGVGLIKEHRGHPGGRTRVERARIRVVHHRKHTVRIERDWASFKDPFACGTPEDVTPFDNLLKPKIMREIVAIIAGFIEWRAPALAQDFMGGQQRTRRIIDAVESTRRARPDGRG
jgi:hypothetical protein